MGNEEKLHLEAAAYATKDSRERQEQRAKNNMPPYDALQETGLWLAAYEGYVAGTKIANQRADVLLLSSKPGTLKRSK
jgi:hypothetical protein